MTLVKTMTYEIFLKLLLTYKKLNEDITELYDIGVDLLEGKYKLSDGIYSLLESALKTTYNQQGIEWVGWFMFESDWGQKDWSAKPLYDNGKIIKAAGEVRHGAVDKDGNPIAYSFESLYELLEECYKN